MHEAQAKDATEQAAPKNEKKESAPKRPYRFYAVVVHRQVDLTTNQPKPTEVLEFEDKGAMRARLENPDYENTEVRVIRGYELKVKAKRNFSVN